MQAAPRLRRPQPPTRAATVALNPETGTTTPGETAEEAVANLREASALYLSEFPMTSRGHPVVTTFSVPEHAQAAPGVGCRRSEGAAPSRVCSGRQTSRLRNSSQPCERDASRSKPTRSGGGACYASRVKVSEVLRMLQADGWYLAAQRGSHRQFKHQSKPGRVTVPGKPSDDLAPGTYNSVLKQAGLK